MLLFLPTCKEVTFFIKKTAKVECEIRT